MDQMNSQNEVLEEIEEINCKTTKIPGGNLNEKTPSLNNIEEGGEGRLISKNDNLSQKITIKDAMQFHSFKLRAAERISRSNSDTRKLASRILSNNNVQPIIKRSSTGTNLKSTLVKAQLTKSVSKISTLLPSSVRK